MMHKGQVEQIKKMIELLDLAHAEIKNALVGKNTELALSLLMQCQQGAITLGNLIEKSETDCQEISLLKNYCEEIYKVYRKVETNAEIKIVELSNILQNAFLPIRESIPKNIKTRRKIVFLPFKVSEWEGFASVWKAAKEDPECDVYVIPIPFYYKNPDGSLKEVQYDGETYPAEFAITKYDEFDFDMHRPDMIFIQTPFDEYNPAISVHPFFYSSNLMQFTENLIYIPYFIMDEFAWTDRRAVEVMENYVVMPGVINANKVIVQSEKTRWAYIEFLTNIAGEDTRRIWEKKIEGWGSPRLDRIKKDMQQEYELAGEQQKLKRPDGGKKNLIVYGTSISVFLQYREQYIRKLQDVLEVFEINSEESVFLWHPCPLEQVKKMLDTDYELIKEYEQIVKKFKEKKWGIYDEFLTEEKVAALGDAYYGDAGSIVRLFYKSKKPVMIQQVKIIPG